MCFSIFNVSILSSQGGVFPSNRELKFKIVLSFIAVINSSDNSYRELRIKTGVSSVHNDNVQVNEKLKALSIPSII